MAINTGSLLLADDVGKTIGGKCIGSDFNKTVGTPIAVQKHLNYNNITSQLDTSNGTAQCYPVTVAGDASIYMSITSSYSLSEYDIFFLVPSTGVMIFSYEFSFTPHYNGYTTSYIQNSITVFQSKSWVPTYLPTPTIWHVSYDMTSTYVTSGHAYRYSGTCISDTYSLSSGCDSLCIRLLRYGADGFSITDTLQITNCAII